MPRRALIDIGDQPGPFIAGLSLTLFGWLLTFVVRSSSVNLIVVSVIVASGLFWLRPTSHPLAEPSSTQRLGSWFGAVILAIVVNAAAVLPVVVSVLWSRKERAEIGHDSNLELSPEIALVGWRIRRLFRIATSARHSREVRAYGFGAEIVAIHWQWSDLVGAGAYTRGRRAIWLSIRFAASNMTVVVATLALAAGLSKVATGLDYFALTWACLVVIRMR